MFLDYNIAENKIRDIISNNQFSDVLQGVVNYLYKHFDAYNWVGIYVVEGEYLILGSWMGMQPTEHTKIRIGRGVCGSAAQSGSGIR